MPNARARECVYVFVCNIWSRNLPQTAEYGNNVARQNKFQWICEVQSEGCSHVPVCHVDKTNIYNFATRCFQERD
jgi:hypothetical protein